MAESEESINHRPPHVSAITTEPNQDIKADSKSVQVWGGSSTKTGGGGELEIGEIIRWKGSILNMEKYFGIRRSIQMDVMTSHDRTKRNEIDISISFCSVSTRSARPKIAETNINNKDTQLKTHAKGKVPLEKLSRIRTDK